ncbi:MAG: hypothetical protein HN576_11670 [Bacteriovoracaceae bacterium]|jgi:hypothetical protein|nr:hypothetical protein [Bacteriovoracaceae bacterium]
MLNIFFIHKNKTDKEYFEPFFLELDSTLINLQFYEEDQQSTKNQLTIIVVKSLKDLENIHRDLSRRLFIAVSFKSISVAEKLDFYQKTSEIKSLKGVIDIDKEYEFNLPVLNSAYQGELENLMISSIFSKDVEEILSQSLSDLQRLKKVHERIVPIRQETIKGLTITSKFGAGESAGGEFLDIVKGDKECLVLLSSSSSYVVSSIILTHFEYFRDKKHFSLEEIERFLRELSADIKERDFVRGDEKNLDVFIARIDLNSLTMEGMYFGDFELYRSKSENLVGNDLPLDEMFFERGYFSSRLKRSEKLMIVSPGFKKNMNELYPGLSVKKILAGFENQTPRQIINEIYFQLKKNISGDFLAHDATVIHIEVDQNVIVQI